MDSESLRTASTYLNNLLLARGLLRNSEPIDFVKPSKESRAQIINLVHDLILREDRDKDQREHAAFTLRQLRAEDDRKKHELERLTTKHDESARAAVQAQTSERTAKEDLKKVEKAMRSLQEQSARLKTALAQVKTQCANDVKKRDLELGRLKTHLQGQQRGSRTAATAPSMTITDGKRRAAFDASVRELGDPAYSLKQETTEFLTQLSQSLSDENDNLIGLIRGAVGKLRELLGLPDTSRMMPDSAIGSRDSKDETPGSGHNSMLHAAPTSYETLATDLEGTLSHLKKLLTNPNFVPLEEVELRDEEIVRLREGWEHMEQRWRDVLVMMQGWLRRMDTGETINIDDLRQGMGMVSPQRRNKRLEHIAEAPDSPQSSTGDRDEHEVEVDFLHASGEEEDDSQASIPSDQPRWSSRLSGNNSPKRKRDVLEPPEFFDLRPASTAQKASTMQSPMPIPLPDFDEDGSEQLEEPQMSVEEKLSAAAREAAAATSGQTTKAFQYHSALDGAADEPPEEEEQDTLGKMPSPVKRTKIRGRPKRRKSTLSREELAELLLVEDVEE